MSRSVAIMPPADPEPCPHFSIVPSETGWLLVIQDEQCSVMQVFQSPTAARHALDRMQGFFETMRSHAGPRPQAAF
jgi:hypothetical protein